MHPSQLFTKPIEVFFKGFTLPLPNRSGFETVSLLLPCELLKPDYHAGFLLPPPHSRCVFGVSDKRVFFDFPDVDECLGMVHQCDGNASCTDVIGSYSCSCKKGYTGNGFACSGNDLEEVD